MQQEIIDSVPCIDGIYSFVACSVGGCSIATVALSAGTLAGNDIAGSRYEGTYTHRDAQHVTLDLSVTFPPGVFGIFGTSVSETFQTRDASVDLPVTLFVEGTPYEIPSYGMLLVARRIPDAFQPLAGRDGIDHMIAGLESAKAHWQRHDAEH